MFHHRPHYSLPGQSQLLILLPRSHRCRLRILLQTLHLSQLTTLPRNQHPIRPICQRRIRLLIQQIIQPPTLLLQPDTQLLSQRKETTMVTTHTMDGLTDTSHSDQLRSRLRCQVSPRLQTPPQSPRCRLLTSLRRYQPPIQHLDLRCSQLSSQPCDPLLGQHCHLRLFQL